MRKIRIFFRTNGSELNTIYAFWTSFNIQLTWKRATDTFDGFNEKPIFESKIRV